MGVINIKSFKFNNERRVRKRRNRVRAAIITS